VSHFPKNARREPYTEAGVRRLGCARCGDRAEHQWKICSDGSWRPLCVACDVALNRLVLEWIGHPRAVELGDEYARRAAA
jgi:hypothetical protein